MWQDAIMTKFACKGISQAHRLCVQKAKDNNWSHVTIFEDDIKFVCKHSFKDYVQGLSDCLNNQNVDVFMTGPLNGFKNNQSAKGLVERQTLTGFQCYTVMRQFYDTFLKAPDDKHIDRWVTENARVYVLWPYVAIQHNGKSDNSNRYANMLQYIKPQDIICNKCL